MEKYDGVQEGQLIHLPPILSKEEEDILGFACHGYMQMLYELLHYFRDSLYCFGSVRPVLLDEDILTNLVRLEMSRRIEGSHRLLTEVLNAMECYSSYPWVSLLGKPISMSQFINQQLSRYVAVRETTMLDACFGQSYCFR